MENVYELPVSSTSTSPSVKTGANCSLARFVALAGALSGIAAGDAFAAGAHQAEGQANDPDGQDQIDNTGSQAEKIVVVFDVENRYQDDQTLSNDQRLGKSPAAAILGHETEQADEAKPDHNHQKEDQRHEQIADAVTVAFVTGSHHGIEAVSDVQEAQHDELDKGGGSGFVGQLHALIISDISFRKPLQNKLNRGSICIST